MPHIQRGRLRPLREENLGLVLEWRNSDRVRNSMLSNHIISWEEHRSWFKRLKENDVYLIFEYMHEAVGLVCFTDMNPSERVCWWGFYLGKDDLPKGAGLLMGYLGLVHVFDNLKIRLLCSKVLATNQISLAYHKKLGFEEEKKERGYIIRDGEKQGVINFSYYYESWLNSKYILQMALKEKIYRGKIPGEQT